ncbi:MAG: hypothetical protein AB1529_02235 [Candidatus Micrarchaeota archaeon]
MAVGKEQIKSYCAPMLRRKTFKFGRLKGLVDEPVLEGLKLAKAFGNPGPSSRRFIRELRMTDHNLRCDISEALRPLGGDSPEIVRHQVLSGIREVFLSRGLHSRFGRPESVGLMLHSFEAFGRPVHVFLDESDGMRVGRARFNMGMEGLLWFELNATQNAARLAQLLDFWLAGPEELDCRPEGMRISLARTGAGAAGEALARAFAAEGLTEEASVLFALDVSCLRLMISRLASIAAESGSPREFLMRSLNAQIGSAFAHEVAHMLEREANGNVPLPRDVMEIAAYMLQALYSDPAEAFRSMMLHGVDVTVVLPSFDSSMRQLGAGAFAVGEDFLRKWADILAGAIFTSLGGRSHEEMLDGQKIREAAGIAPISMEHMQFIERAMCNPNLRITEE